MTLSTNEVTTAKHLLDQGKLVAIPTETVYGLAANALDPEAVARIFVAKKRPHFDPLIVHLSGLDQLSDYCTDIPEKAWILARHFWPGPLTLVLPKKECIPDLVTSGLATVGVRVPNHPLTLSLLRQLSYPLAAPSANPFGYISPTCAEHVAAQLGDEIAYILDGGPCEVGLESTIVGFPEGEPVVFRKGGISIESVEALLGPVAVQTTSSSNPSAPGMLLSHYAPRTPLFLYPDGPCVPSPFPDCGYLRFSTWLDEIPRERQRVLSEKGDLQEAAQNLFAYLRQLDQLGLPCIGAELVPNQGLGMAINDRIHRAVTKRN